MERDRGEPLTPRREGKIGRVNKVVDGDNYFCMQFKEGSANRESARLGGRV
jgi:hypothetical protein